MHWNTKYIITSFVTSSVQASSRQCSIKMIGSYGKFGKPDVLVEWKASFISNSLSVLFPFFTSLSLLPVPRFSDIPPRCSVKCFQCRTSPRAVAPSGIFTVSLIGKTKKIKNWNVTLFSCRTNKCCNVSLIQLEGAIATWIWIQLRQQSERRFPGPHGHSLLVAHSRQKDCRLPFFLLYNVLNKCYYIFTFFKEIARLRHEIWLFKVTFSL